MSLFHRTFEEKVAREGKAIADLLEAATNAKCNLQPLKEDITSEIETLQGTLREAVRVETLAENLLRLAEPTEGEDV